MLRMEMNVGKLKQELEEEPRDDWEAVDENGNVLVGFM